MGPDLFDALGRIVGPRWVRHRRAELKTYAMDGLPTRESYPGVVVMPASAQQVRETVRLLHLAGVPFVARGAGTGLSGGAVADPDAVLIAAHAHESHPRGGSGAPPRGGAARRGERAALRGGGAARAPLRPRPVEPDRLHRRRQRGRERGRARTASSTASRPTTSSSSRWSCPTARWSGSARRTASPGDPTWWACSSAAKGCSASPPRSPCGSSRMPPSVRTLLGRLPHRARGERGGLRDHRHRHRPGRDGDDGPRLRRRGGGVDLRRGLSHRRRRRAAGRARRPARRGRRRGRHGRRPSCASAARARCGAPRPPPTAPGSGRAARRRSARWGGSRPTSRCRTPWCRAPRCPRSWTASPRSATATASASATSSTPATATCTPTSVRPARPRRRRSGCTWPATEIMAACVDGRRQHHRRARRRLRQARLHALDLRRRDARRDARGAAGVRSRRAGQSGQGRARPRLPRVARGAGGPMSDVVHGRLRALLGTSRRGARSGGLPRAIPDTADALSLVCRLAHEEGWKIRVEGQGTWLPADAPADLAVSTRALDQVRLGEPGRSRGHHAGRHAARDDPAAPGRPGHVAGARSAGPARAQPRLGHRHRHRRPAPPRVRPGARSRARLHRGHRRWPAGQGRRPGGEERGRATISPSFRSAGSAGSASWRRRISGSARCPAPT